MTVKAILEAKGHAVVTLGPNAKLAEAIQLLADRRIGALVITNGDRKIVGILSERDVVRVVAKEGAAALELPVRAVMTPKVKICNANHTVNEVMEIMTNGRFRHLPASSRSATWSSGASRRWNARPSRSRPISRRPDFCPSPRGTWRLAPPHAGDRPRGEAFSLDINDCRAAREPASDPHA